MMMIVVVVSKYNTRLVYYTTLKILTITLQQLLLCTVLLLCNHNHYCFQVVDGFSNRNILHDDFSFGRRRGCRRRCRRVEDISRSISITRMILLHDQRTTSIWMNNDAYHGGGWRIEREDDEQHDVQPSSSCSSSSRRDVFRRCIPPSILLLWFGCGVASSAATASARTATGLASNSGHVQQESIGLPLENSDDPSLIDVYFGCGCFWCVQHEMVEAERRLLGRTNDLDLTSRAAYAGGREDPGKQQQQPVCYHTSANTNINEDYVTLGHAEVVSLTIPKSSFGKFASMYCKFFRNGMRPDQFGDRGRQYRNIVGIPGGVTNSKQLVQQLLEASRQAGDQLDFAEGSGRGNSSKNSNGDDEDIPRLVWIMDSSKFRPYKAEAYHQFHDGFFLGEKYGREYNSITKRLVEENGEDDFGPSCPTSS